MNVTEKGKENVKERGKGTGKGVVERWKEKEKGNGREGVREKEGMIAKFFIFNILELF